MAGNVEVPRLSWQEGGLTHSALWRAENGALPPRRIEIADDSLSADAAYRLVCEGTALLWRGDFQNARLLLDALKRRIERKPRKITAAMPEAFHLHRQAQAQRARTLGMLLLPLAADYTVPLRRAPEVQVACLETYGPGAEDSVVSLRELLSLISAHEWRKKGVMVLPLGARIHPHYGVFSPVRGEYLDLIQQADLPSTELAFDIGTGTGVIAALLAKRGVAQVIATELAPRALACARDNIARLGYAKKVEVIEADLFPPGCAPLIVCNPPWLPGKPTSMLEHAVYDPDSQMLRGYLAGLAEHLTPKGEGWLILSDLAEHLGLRTRTQLLEWIAAAGLRVFGRHNIRPQHPRSKDASDPLHVARAAEMTTLWRLGA
ncbi:class I SAM-dependent methyltransferase [Uliginosibacterium sp. 31-16]|uniref:N5-glutamine methyltransferase family protein n=1 Tax=Uliginosibacterium sp. 31-16 TaxID=3068315 RepID=UPI00273F0741|nr:class I SAM-dependent methyltransferase [Uliginosibacterium sp. 31-16]MDP5241074.1 class I SAM-dependent methyltransferase [Uliginosibacterium sp. 31-16]